MSSRPGKNYAYPLNAFCEHSGCLLVAVWETKIAGRSSYLCEQHGRAQHHEGAWTKTAVDDGVTYFNRRCDKHAWELVGSSEDVQCPKCEEEKNNPPLDLTKPVQTRNGRKARIIASDAKVRYNGLDYPLAVLVCPREQSDEEVVWIYRRDGTAPGGPGCDLINVPEKKKHQCVRGSAACWEWSSGDLVFSAVGAGVGAIGVEFCPFCGVRGGAK